MIFMNYKLTLWVKITLRIYSLSSIVEFVIIGIITITGYALGYIPYPIIQLLLLYALLILTFYSPVITILFMLFKGLKLLSQKALMDNMFIIITNAIVFCNEGLFGGFKIINIGDYYNIDVTYFLSFIIAIFIDKFSVLDKLRLKYKAIRNKITKKQ